MEKSVTALAWKVLFDEEYRHTPDPNKPENTAFFNAKKKRQVDQLKQFIDGPGKVLFERWKDKIKKNTLALICNPEVQKCSCSTCLLAREIQAIFSLLLEAEEALSQDKK